MVSQYHHSQLQERHLSQSNDTGNKIPLQQSPVTYVLQELRKILPDECYPRPVSALESPNLPFIQCPKEHRRYYDMDAINAISSQDIVTLRRWHQEGRPLQTSNERGETLLHMACRRTLLDVVEFLVLEACVSLWVHDKKGRTPLHVACNSLDPRVFQLFHFIVKQDTDLLFVSDEEGCTPLDHTPCKMWNDWIEFFKRIDFHDIVPKRTTFLSFSATEPVCKDTRNTIENIHKRSTKYSAKSKQRNESRQEPEDENALLVARNPRSSPGCNKKLDRRTLDRINIELDHSRNCSQLLNDIASSPIQNIRRGLRKLDNGIKYNSGEVSKGNGTNASPAQSPSILERTEKLSKLWQENSPLKFGNEDEKGTSNGFFKNDIPNIEVKWEGSGPSESSQLTPKKKKDSSQPRVKKGAEVYDRGHISNSTREVISDQGKKPQKQLIQPHYLPPELSPRRKIKRGSDGIFIPKVHSPRNGYTVDDKSKEKLIPEKHIPFRSSALKSPRKSSEDFMPILRSDDESDKLSDRPRLRRALSGTSIDERVKTSNSTDELIREKISILKKNHPTTKNHIPSKPSPRRTSSRGKEGNFVASPRISPGGYSVDESPSGFRNTRSKSLSTPAGRMKSSDSKHGTVSMLKNRIDQNHTPSRSPSRNRRRNEDDSSSADIRTAQSCTSTDEKPYRFQYPGTALNGRIKDSSFNQEHASEKSNLTKSKLTQEKHAAVNTAVDDRFVSNANYPHSELSDRFQNTKSQLTRSAPSTSKEESISERISMVRSHMRGKNYISPKHSPQKSRSNATKHSLTPNKRFSSNSDDVDRTLDRLQNKNLRTSIRTSENNTSSKYGLKHNNNESFRRPSPLRHYTKASNNAPVTEAHVAQQRDSANRLLDQSTNTRSQPTTASDERKKVPCSNHQIIPEKNRSSKHEQIPKTLISPEEDSDNPSSEQHQNTGSMALAIIEKRWHESMKEENMLGNQAKKSNDVSSNLSPPRNHRKANNNLFAFEAHISQKDDPVKRISDRFQKTERTLTSRLKKELSKEKKNMPTKPSPSKNNRKVADKSDALEMHLLQSIDSTHEKSHKIRSRSRTRSDGRLRASSLSEKKNVSTSDSTHERSHDIRPQSRTRSDTTLRVSRSSENKSESGDSDYERFQIPSSQLRTLLDKASTSRDDQKSEEISSSKIMSRPKNVIPSKPSPRKNHRRADDDLFPPEVQFSDGTNPIDRVSAQLQDAKLRDESTTGSKASKKVKEQSQESDDTPPNPSHIESHGRYTDDLFALDDPPSQNNDFVDGISDIFQNAKFQSTPDEVFEDDDCKDCRGESLLTRFDVEDIVLGHIHYEYGASNDGSQICYLQLSLSSSIAELASDINRRVSSRPQKKTSRKRNKYRRLPSV